MRSRTERRTALKGFDKYELYIQSVQNVENELDFINEKYRELRGRTPKVLREDFCGTGALACEWVRQGPRHRAYGLDLDPEPLEYGLRHLTELSLSELKRIALLRMNVLHAARVRADVVVALNFSYFVLKRRQDLVRYFASVRRALKPGGVFFIDLMGGPDCQKVVEEKTRHEGFTYFWECSRFNPITHECVFAIHFQPRGHKKVRNVFTYDWRLWSLPELRDALAQAGFKRTIAYWEGDDGKGGGNGVFTASEDEDNCDCWISYVAALK